MNTLLFAIPQFGEFVIHDTYINDIFSNHYEGLLCYVIVKWKLEMNLSYINDLSKKVYLIEKVNEEQWIAQDWANREILQK
jgi:hypothetical protein